MITSWFKYLFSLLIIFLYYSCNGTDSTETSTVEPDSAHYHYQQQANTKDRRKKLEHINRALNLLQEKDRDLHLKLLRQKVVNHYYLDDIDSTLLAATLLIEQARVDNNLELQAQGYFFRGWAYKGLEENTSSFEDSFKAKELFIQLGDSAYAGRAWFNMAIVQQNGGDYSGAQKSATQTLRWLHPQNDSSFISAAHNEIGRSYYAQRLYEQAVREFEQAYLFGTTPQSAYVHRVNMAINFGKIGKEAEAIALLNQLLLIPNLSEDRRMVVKRNLAYLEWQQNPSQDISKELGSSYRYFKETNNYRQLLLSLNQLVIYHQSQDSSKALEYAREHLNIASDYGNPEIRLDALGQLIELSPPEQSKDFAKEYIRLSDSLTHARLQVKNLFAKIQYDEEQKELEILKLENRAARQDAELAVQRQRLFGVGAIAVILFLGGGFMFYYLQLKHEKEQLKQSIQVEARIAKKIHDELANDMYVVMTQLEDKVPAKYIDQLENIYLRTRDISRENSSITTGGEFSSHLMGMLQSYIPAGGRFFTPGFENVPWTSLSEEIQITIFRSLQELMTNMKKHSNSQVVVIDFNYTTSLFTITYTDRGVGMSQEKVKFKNGLENVENRISAVAGSINFESSEGEGVKATIKIPV